jgi:RNA polymerase sigma factor (sigma-70 family)
MSAESSVELFRLAKTGDKAALDRLLSRHVPALRRLVHGRLPRWARDIADTEDLVQDIVAKTLKQLPKMQIERPGDLYAYLRQGTLNQIRNELRRTATHPRRVELAPELHSASTSPLERAISAEALARYDACLNKLTPIDREAIIGRLELGLTFAELAQALDKRSPDAARVAVSRALVRLTEFLVAARPPA